MAGRVRQRWEDLRSRGAKALIPYITPEFPVVGSTVPLVQGLEQAGASFIEIGIPFSDPLADGPVIQHSSQVALKNGATPSRVLEIVREVREVCSLPILLMGYVNPILRIGVERFMKTASMAGADGLIIPDLPPGEAAEIHAAAESNGLSMVYLIAPTSSDQRIREIDALSTDFSYCVSITGVTGAHAGFAGQTSLDGFLRRVRAATTKPFVVGFGISSAEDVRRVWEHADGAVVGSQLLRAIGKSASPVETAKQARDFLTQILPDTTPQGAGV